MAKQKSEIGVKAGAMTLFEAKNKAREYTLEHRDKKMYILVSIESGDCSVSFAANVPGHETHHCYKNGSEISIATVDVTPKEKTPKGVKKIKEENMSTEVNAGKGKASTPAKKEAKTSPAKKAEKKSATKKSAPVKASTKLGKKQKLTIAEIIKLMKGSKTVAGKVLYHAASGKRVNLKKISKKVNQELVREVQIAE